MKPTIASANRWIARKALEQAHQKRFLRAAAILHWQRVVGVAASFWVLHSVIGTSQTQILIRVGYVLVALGYLWTDVYYEAKELRRRHTAKALHRRYLQQVRHLWKEPGAS